MKTTIIKHEDVKWEMTWNTKKFPTKPEKEVIFKKEKALAVLLANGVIFLNNHWWEETWPEEAKKLTSLNVNCNDVFAWGIADAEPLYYEDLKELYELWELNARWGPVVWCCLKRKVLPQEPVLEGLLKCGIWNILEMGLAPNPYDEFCKKRGTK